MALLMAGKRRVPTAELCVDTCPKYGSDLGCLPCSLVSFLMVLCLNTLWQSGGLPVFVVVYISIIPCVFTITIHMRLMTIFFTSSVTF